MSTVQPRRAARAIADLTAGSILATVDIAASPERVFRALASEDIVRWWGSDDMYRTTAWTGDVRVGGAWRSSGVAADGSEFSVGGEYLEVDPPRRLVHTWKPSWDEVGATTVTYTLAAIDGGTRLTLRHDGFGDNAASCDGHAHGWERVLGWLDGFASGPPAEDPRQAFLVRLVPPRPTFLVDMTPEEGAVMQAHGAYWAGKLAAGVVVAFGPVADPEGVWGVGILRAKDEAEVKVFEAGDPVIRSERGFRYEILPMPRLIAR
jgi:uncharacterized protein YndB with AHSA1/START domain/uncharacterized protein YciI